MYLYIILENHLVIIHYNTNLPFNLRVIVELNAYEIGFEDLTAKFILIKGFFLIRNKD